MSVTYAKTIKQLEKQNEIVYNKKHPWMRKLYLQFLNDRFPKSRPLTGLYPSRKNLLSDCYLANCLDQFWAKPKSTKPVMRLLHGYLGRALNKKGLKWSDRPIATETQARITKSTKYAEYVSRGATTLSPTEELKINQLGASNLLHSTAQIIFLLGIWATSRGLDPLRTLNKHIQFEDDRTVCGYLRPRVNHCFLTDKTHKDAQAVQISEAQTLEKSIECGCEDGSHHDQRNITCQITAVQSFFAYKQPLWENFYEKMKLEGKDNAEINLLWEEEPFLDRFRIL